MYVLFVCNTVVCCGPIGPPAVISMAYLVDLQVCVAPGHLAMALSSPAVKTISRVPTACQPQGPLKSRDRQAIGVTVGGSNTITILPCRFSFIQLFQIIPQLNQITGHFTCNYCDVASVSHGILQATDCLLWSADICPSSGETYDSAVYTHLHISGHSINPKEVIILDREQDWFRRGIREAVHKRIERPSWNKRGGL